MIGLLLFLAAGQASANIVYTFSGVTFDDGGTLTGTFETNDAITTLLDFDITTSPGVGIGFHYTPGTADSSSTSLPFVLVLNTPPALDHILQVTFAGGLTASGATIALGTFDSFEQGLAGARRVVTAGEASIELAPVPEPATIVLLGIAALGFLTSIGRRPQA